jgi:hypothetical protein
MSDPAPMSAPAPISLKYFVHSVNPTEVWHQVAFRGTEIQARVPGLEVQLTHEDAATESAHGSLTLRFVGADADAAKEVFKQDGFVTISVEAVPSEAPATAEPDPATAVAAA